jgi:hypothetical protein
MFLAGVPFVIASYAMSALPARNLTVFFIQVLATLPIYFLAVAFIFRGYVRQQVVPRIRSVLFSNAQ